MITKILMTFLLVAFSCAYAGAQENSLQNLVDNEKNKLRIRIAFAFYVLNSCLRELAHRHIR